MPVFCNDMSLHLYFVRIQKKLTGRKNSSHYFRRIYLLVLGTFSSLSVAAQEYFQQKVEYTISVKLNDTKHELSCFQSLVYTNNSPNVLKELYIHLWPNAYKDENTPLARSYYLDGFTVMLNLKKEKSGYIDSLDFQVNGEKVSWNLLPDSIDICKIKLNQDLAPGASLTLTTPFHIKIPSAKLSRLGHLDQAYFITQWYPKPAVYDKNGWNYFSYLDKGEYYGEFGTFDVRITLPENYVVGATGELVDGEKEIQWLTSKADQTAKLDSFPSDMTFPQSSDQLKTLHYRQENVHDFAWFADKRWNVLKGEINIQGVEKPITSWAFFTNVEAEYWKKVPEHLHDAVVYFSNWIDPYPYSSVTAVDVTKASGDGMEYPMITAIGSYGDEFELEEAIVHEVAHNWFYGIVGNNERRHGWMDESLTNFYETRFLYTKHANDSSRQEEKFVKMGKSNRFFGMERMNHRESQYLSYLMAARKNTDQQPDLSSEEFSRLNYPKSVYHKLTLGFDYMLNYMGDSLFDACIKNYYESWKYKHPDPADMKNSFVNTSGKNLDWFFDDLIFSTKKINYSICKISKIKNDGSYELTLKNTKQIAAPISINGLRNGKNISSTWVEGFKGKQTISLSCKECDAIRIDAAERMPELYRDDNTIKTSGILKRKEKLRFIFPALIEDPTSTWRFFAPIAGWNLYNGSMAGIVLHNVFLPEKRFEYTLAPMFAFKTKDLAGGGDLRYHIYPANGFIQKITLKTGFSHYAYGTSSYTNLAGDFTFSTTLKYSKVDNRIVILLKEKKPRNNVKKQITFRHVLIRKDLIYNSFLKSAPTQEYNYFQGEYSRENLNPLKSSSINLQITGNYTFYKIGLEVNRFINYNSTKKGFRIRMFAGYLDRSVTNDPGGADYRLRFSGNGGGARIANYTDDYLFDEVFLGRSENSGILSQQFSVTEGGMTIPTYGYYLADQWLVSLHLSTSLPGALPFRIYLGLATLNNANIITESKSISYEAGIEFPVIKDIFVIYFPLAFSSDLRNILEDKNIQASKMIRFELNFKKLNPLELIRKINF